MKPVWTMRRHAIAWSVLGMMALVYIWSILGLPYPNMGTEQSLPGFASREQSTILPDMRNSSTSASARLAMRGGESAQTGTRPANTPLARSQTLALREEMETLRRHVEELKRREETLNERVSTIESAFGPATASLPKQGDPNPARGKTLAYGRLTARAPDADISYLPLPADGFGDNGIAAVSPIPVAGIKKPTQTLFGVELGKASSADALQKKWKALTVAHYTLLSRLDIRSQKISSRDGNTAMKLIAGPFPNAADAARLCAKLKAAGTNCTETIFSGGSP